MFRIVVLQYRAAVSALVCVIVLAACASAPTQAPVTDLSPSTTTESVRVATPGQTYYTVKRGDTLFSIAQQFGQDYRQVATWNNINNGYHIHLGQVLRVAPPENTVAPVVAQAEAEVAEAAPVTGSQIEQQPLGAGPSASGASSSVAPVESEPSGQKRPYSDATLAEMSGPEGATSVGPTTPAAPETSTASPAPAAPVAAIAATPAPEQGAGQKIAWSWPATGPLIGQFVESKNKGIDIGGKMGTDVVAAADGRVIYVGAGVRGLGNLVVIKHSPDLISVYGHNSRSLVTAEQTVKRGQKIAEMGNSDSDQVELHFEIRRQGKPVDPLTYLPAR